MVASRREALRALLGGRAGAFDSIASGFVVVGDMALSNWAMLVVVVVGCGSGSLRAWWKAVSCIQSSRGMVVWNEVGLDVCVGAVHQ